MIDFENLLSLAVRGRAERERQLVRAIVQVREIAGEAALYRNGILVSETGFRRLAALATIPVYPPSPFAYFAGIQVYTAPDWTFDHALIARLRFRVTIFDRWARPLVRSIARWLG